MTEFCLGILVLTQSFQPQKQPGSFLEMERDPSCLENNRIPDSFSVTLVFCYCLGDGREFNPGARWSLTVLALGALSGMEFFLEVIPRLDRARWPRLTRGGTKERECS